MTARAFLTGGAPSWLRLSLCRRVLGTGAWAAGSTIAVPTDLPNRTDQGELRLRWALVRSRPCPGRGAGRIGEP